MNLTSLSRVKSALGITKSDEDGVLQRLIATASNRIARYLRRDDGLELKARTEYFNPTLYQRVFYPKAYPIVSITSICTDATGQYTGTLTPFAASDYLIGADSRSVWLTNYTLMPYLIPLGGIFPKSLRMVYTAGLAADPVVSAWTKSGGTLTPGYFVLGESSRAFGKVTATASGTVSIECLAGPFTPGETLTEYQRYNYALMDGGPVEASGQSCTLTACTSASLAEAYPDLVEACEMHVRYLRTNRTNFENLTVTQDGATRYSRSEMTKDYSFLPEVRDILDTYKNTLVA